MCVPHVRLKNDTVLSLFFRLQQAPNMGKSSKKGRITGGQRKEINERTVGSAIDGDLEGTEFARVLRHLGSGHIRIILANKREGIAKIRTVLSKRGSTPIVMDDIVVVSGREFETRAKENTGETTDRYDVLGVLTRQQAARLEKDGRIPTWFVSVDEGRPDEADIFDFTEDAEGADSDVDVDAI